MNGDLWVLRASARWHDLPERYGNWKTAHKRFTRWAKAGVWQAIFAALTADPDNKYVKLDSTVVRTHQQAATGKGGTKSGCGAFQRWTDHQDPSRWRNALDALNIDSA